MKCFIYLIMILLVLSGCRVYEIDSNPQGLRVTINDIDRGETPLICRANTLISGSLDVEVKAPTTAQIKMYEITKNKTVKNWVTHNQTKYIYPDDSSSGTIIFDFITDEDFANETIPVDESDAFVGWRIESNPSGLRISVNNIEVGTTPLNYRPKNINLDFVVEVAAPMKQDIKKYEDANKKIVSTWRTVPQKKNIVLGYSDFGTVFFQFIASEYDEPTTEEEWEWVKAQCEHDWEELEKEKKLRIELENK